MSDILFKLDDVTENLLKYIVENYKNFDAFLTELKPYFIKEQLMYDNIVDNKSTAESYGAYYMAMDEAIETYFHEPYNITINQELLLDLSMLLNKEAQFREKNIIHRHFLHDISDYKQLEKQMTALFTEFHALETTTLEKYTFLMYHLYRIYPFFNALPIRMLGDIFLLKNDYLPVILSSRFKADYYYIFQYDFNRFNHAFMEILLRNLNFLSEKLGIIK